MRVCISHYVLLLDYDSRMNKYIGLGLNGAERITIVDIGIIFHIIQKVRDTPVFS